MNTRPRPLTSRIVGVHGDTRDFRVTGPLRDLEALIALHVSEGTLVHATAPQPLGPADAVVKLRLRNVIHGTVPMPYPPGFRPEGRPLASTPGIPPQRFSRSKVAVTVTAITGAVTGILTALAYLAGQLAELIAAHAVLILGVLGLAAIIAGLLARHSSNGRHCPGC